MAMVLLATAPRPVFSRPLACQVRRSASSRRRVYAPSVRRALANPLRRGGVGNVSGRPSAAQQLSSDAPLERQVDELSISQLVSLAERGLREPGSVYSAESPISNREELAQGLRTSTTKGLCESVEALRVRAQKWGRNKLPEAKSFSFLDLLVEAIQDVTLYALIAAGIFSLITGYLVGGDSAESGSLEGIAILASVSVVVLVTAVNNYQKEMQFQELNAVKEDVQIRVVRNGVQTTISTFDLMTGDLLVIEGGDILPADCILVSGSNLKVDESHLTGESEEVLKEAVGSPLVVSGSKVNEGSAQAIVIAVGSNSQSGVISLLAGQGATSSSGEESGDGMRKTTVLEEKLEIMANQIGQFGLWAALATTLLMSAAFSWDTFFVAGDAWSWDFLSTYLDFLITGITVLVVAVPEGLPLAVTLALAFSVKQMLREKNLVRQLGACETMGCATTILSDKTGTLTQNRMTAVRLWVGGSSCELNLGGSGMLSSRSMADSMMKFTFSEDAGPAWMKQVSDTRCGRVLATMEEDFRCLLLQAIALNTTASYIADPDGSGVAQWVGSQTEGALLELAHLGGCNVAQMRESFTTKNVLPFSSQRKCMGCLAVPKSSDGGEEGERGRFFVKGAPDVLLRNCTTMLNENGEVVPMGDVGSFNLEADGLRVIALAYKDIDMEPVDIDSTGCYDEEMMEDLTMVGLVGIQDPIRPEVPAAIKQCQGAGITVRMLTGDNASTGASIARQVGILEAGDNDAKAVMDAQTFRDLVTNPDGSADAEKFFELWPSIRVLARCTPTHKFEIVKRLQASREGSYISSSMRREVLAMTGDGTNDAPALRAADVGFGMNSGTSIAKAASDIVIMDDSFSSIVSAVRWGRNVYMSITKFLQFQLTINIVAVAITVIGAAVLHRSPLGAVQMLWVNLIMDSLASLALATESPTDALLKLPPFSADAPLLSSKVLKHIAGQAVYQLSVLLGLLAFGNSQLGLDMEDPAGRLELFTLVFNSLVQMSLFNQLNCRRVSDEADVLDGLVNNRIFLYIMTGEFVLQWVIVQYGGGLFKTTALDWREWGLCMLFGAGSFAVRQLLLKVPDPQWSLGGGTSPPSVRQATGERHD